MSCLQDFKIMKKLGSGTFSSVYLVLRKSDNEEYAMKKVVMTNLSPQEKQNALNEVRILASINSPYIVGYKDTFFDAQENALFIILEYVAGSDLSFKIDYVRKKGNGYYFDETIIWTYLIQMLRGLFQLHSQMINSEIIKQDEAYTIGTLSDHKYLKLGDLNVAKVVSNQNMLARTQTGTPFYASPEVWKNQPYDGRCDIWSMGCVLYEMTALCPPFVAQNLDGLSKKVVSGVYESIHPRYSRDLGSVIGMCLQVNPNKRFTAEQILQSGELMSRSQLVQQDIWSSELLGTIYVPKDLKDLKNRLPKPKFITNVSILDNMSVSSTNLLSVFKIKKIIPNSNSPRVDPLIQIKFNKVVQVTDRPSSINKRSSSQDLKKEINTSDNDIKFIQGIYQLDRVVRGKSKHKISSPIKSKYSPSVYSNEQPRSEKKIQQKLIDIIKQQKPTVVRKIVLPPIQSCKNLTLQNDEEPSSRRLIKKAQVINVSLDVNVQSKFISKLLKKGQSKPYEFVNSP